MYLRLFVVSGILFDFSIVYYGFSIFCCRFEFCAYPNVCTLFGCTETRENMEKKKDLGFFLFLLFS